jgi:asparagine synthetase B (glutamine-hydrolysing)
MKAGQGAIQHERYWHPEDILERRPVPDDELFERFDALMSQAVRRCLAGRDVVSLSGGLDSPAVAAYAAPAHVERFGQPLKALSYFFPDHPSVDESSYIRAVVKELGIKLHSYAPQCRASTDRLAEWMALVDGPIPVMALSENEEHLRVAKSLGFRNVLTGEMAEFVFDLDYDVLAYLVARRRLRSAVRYVRSMASLGGGGGYRSLRTQVVRGVLPVWARALYRRLRGQPVAPTVAAPEWIDRRMLIQIPLESAKDGWRRRQMLPFEGQALSLEANDYLQSSTGVMMRRPFADVDLWEFFLGLPAETKHPDGRSKILVRGFLKGKVPEVILNRRDKTFFDEYIQARMDYDALRGWLCEPDGYRVPGVDYDRLRKSLEKEELDLRGFMWAKDLACVHAFVSGAR